MKTLRRILCFLLALALLAALLGCAGSSGPQTSRKITNGLHSAKAILPQPAPQRALVDDAQAMAVGSYLVARMYLEKLLQYDVDQGNKEEYDQLLADTLTAFENADKLAATLQTAVENAELIEAAGAAAYLGQARSETLASRQIRTGNFIPTVSAADDPPAVKWAKEITAIYDSAPAMKGVRTLANQLGTDAKHAYAQLKQAQAILEGAAYDDFGDYANKCYQTAVVLKAAGTTAGFVASVAVAGPATGLAAVAQTGGIVMNGVNTVLEVGQAGTIITTNGEGNEYTAALEKTENQMAPIGQVFNVMSIGLNAHKLLTGGYGKDAAAAAADGTYSKYLDGVKNDAFGVTSYLGTSAYDYATGGSILSGTITHTDKGMEFTLWDTLTGKTESDQKFTKGAMEQAGIPREDVETAQKTENPKPPALNEVPLSEANKIIDEYSGIGPGSGFDADAYGKAIQEKQEEVMTELLEEEAYTGELPKTHSESEDGGTYDFYNGTGVLIDPATGTKVMWTHDENGELILISSDDSEYTTDEDGNLFKDGEPVFFNGVSVNVRTGTGDLEPTEETADVAELFNGQWLFTNEYTSVVKTITVVDEETLTISWLGTVFGSGAVNTITSTNKFTFDSDTGVMTLRETGCSDPWQATTAEYFTFTLDGDTITTYYYRYISNFDDDGGYVYSSGPGGTYTRVGD